jgi:hypothetical protein
VLSIFSEIYEMMELNKSRRTGVKKVYSLGFVVSGYSNTSIIMNGNLKSVLKSNSEAGNA